MVKKRKRVQQKTRIITVSALCILFIVLAIILTINSLRRVVFSSRIEEEKKYQLKYKEEEFETVGWIQVQGTNIDYPIVFHEGGESTYPVEVTSYAWLSNFKVGFHNHMIVSGHNIFNLSSQPDVHSELFERFEELLGFVYYDIAKKNQYMKLTMAGKEYIYKIFAVDFMPIVKRLEYPLLDDYTKDEMQHVLDVVEEYNIYDYDVDVNKNDSILTVSTCSRFFGDSPYEFKVIGRLLRDGEDMGLYSVKKNKNYEKISERLEGDEEDEEI